MKMMYAVCACGPLDALHLAARWWRARHEALARRLMAALRRAPQAWVWHAELSAHRPRNASVNLQHMYEPVRSSVLAGLRSYVRGGHSWNVSARIVSDAALLQASFEQQTARRLLERKLRPLRAGDLFVWLGSGPVSKTGPVWPASADQAADWPRLAEAPGRLRRDLAQS